MAEQCRDWLTSLWPASYKGVRFYFQSDDEEGGRGLVIHEFPNRDEPFVEDLGEAPRFFDGNAYVAGDDADRAAVTLTEMLATRGAGTLVVPIRGPVQVHCQSFKRRHERDQLGYVAFQIKFVREGASTALISTGHLSALGYQAADRLAAALAGLYARGTNVQGQPDHVASAATAAAQAALLSIDAVRLQEPVEPEASARIRDAIDAVYDLTPALLSRAGPADAADVDAAWLAIARYTIRPDTGDAETAALAGPYAAAAAIVALTRATADALEPAAAARAMRDLAEANAYVLAPAYSSPSGRRAAENEAAAARTIRLAALAGFAEALIRRTYRSRPEGVSARAEAAARFEAELNAATGAEFADLFVAAQDLRSRVVEFLSRLIADLAPVVTVEAARILPSLWWSWRLYAAADRAGELVDRNQVRHPSFMPRTFQALAR